MVEDIGFAVFAAGASVTTIVLAVAVFADMLSLGVFLFGLAATCVSIAGLTKHLMDAVFAPPHET